MLEVRKVVDSLCVCRRIEGPHNFLKSVAIQVNAAGTTGSSAADKELIGGTILGIYPTANQDQLIDSVALNADGSITVTLAAAATANNNFKVTVLKG